MEKYLLHSVYSELLKKTSDTDGCLIQSRADVAQLQEDKRCRQNWGKWNRTGSDWSDADVTSRVHSRWTDGDGERFPPSKEFPSTCCSAGVPERRGVQSPQLTARHTSGLMFLQLPSDFHFNTHFNVCKRLQLLFHYRPINSTISGSVTSIWEPSKTSPAKWPAPASEPDLMLHLLPLPGPFVICVRWCLGALFVWEAGGLKLCSDCLRGGKGKVQGLFVVPGHSGESGPSDETSSPAENTTHNRLSVLSCSSSVDKVTFKSIFHRWAVDVLTFCDELCL